MEQLVERVEDLTPLVYDRFFKLHPEALPMFGVDIGDVTKRKMLNGIIMAVMDQAEGRSDDSRTFFWASDHVAYDTTFAMYRTMFSVLLETLEECLGDDWNSAVHDAWKWEFDRMINPVKEAYAKTSHVTPRETPPTAPK